MGGILRTLRGNRPPMAPTVDAPTTCPPPYYDKPSAFRPSYNPAADHNGRSDIHENEAPVAAPPPRKAVIVFHSASRWRAYYEASKKSNKLVVIYFTATWCAPCRYMESTVNELAANFSDVDFVKIDVDELLNVSLEYGVQAMPTFLLMEKGKEVDKVIGARKEELRTKIEKHRV